MKAAIYMGDKTFYPGESVLISPQTGEVGLKIAYCGICGTDVHIYHGNMDHRVKIPQIIGHEVSAQVVTIGDDVSGIKIGDRVVIRPLQAGAAIPADKGYTHIGRNLKFMGIDTPGGMQAYWTVPANTIHLLPDNVPLREGALIEPLAVACHDVRRARVKEHEYVVVIGGGPIGLLISLVAKSQGANVLLVEINEKRRDLAEKLGLSVVNPRQVDLVKAIDKFSDGVMADVVFEVSGSTNGVKEMTRLPNVRGRIVMVAIHSQPREIDLFSFFWKEVEMVGARVYEPQDFEMALSLAAHNMIPLEALISDTVDIGQVQQAFEQIDSHPDGMKYLIKCTD